MRTFLMLPVPLRSAYLVLLFLLLVLQITVFCLRFRDRHQANWMQKRISGFFAAGSLVLLCFLAEGEKDCVRGNPMWMVTERFLEIPVWALVLFFVVASCFTARSLWQGLAEQKGRITRASIRESADFLPSGLCFARMNGQPLLINRKMQELSRILCGEALQNGERFWKTIAEGDLGERAYRSRFLDIPALVLPDGSAWMFERQIIELKDQPVVQITATDATELYQLTCKIREENAVLRSMNAQLKVYGRKVEELTRTQERLAMKVQLHDSIGQNLLATRHFLMQEAETLSQLDAEQVLKKWRRSVAMLRQEAEPEKPAGGLQYLIDAARSAGVEVDLTGNFPQTGLAAELITSAGAEALTNAVRHAGAKTLRITASETELVYRVSFTNDGRVPEDALQEGGGLSGLRRRIEGAGGTMTVSSEPEFMLMITIPREGKVGVI